MIRRDLADRIYKTLEAKFQAVVKEIKERYQKGQPVLVGTTSIEKNEYLGKLLEREGIPHQILNAKNHEREGEIIAQAGKWGAVTIATNMAGRGVDIMLGGNPQNLDEAKKVIELGGLHVIGTERHEARRIDNQLRGRSGRQGDPGSSQFFVSLEDDLMRIFGGDRIKSLMGILKIPEDQPIEAHLVSKAIEEAQSKIEGLNFDLRKHLLDYDDVMNIHRETIYRKREEILSAPSEELRDKILEIFLKSGFKKEDFEKKEKEIGKENFFPLAKLLSLRILDNLWIEHLENMEYLRDSVRLRAYGQMDPLIEYKNEGHKMFQELLRIFESMLSQTILRISSQPIPKSEFAQPMPSAGLSKRQERKKIGRNDPCPCGKKNPITGRPMKYKKCCYPRYG
jgi:preprotein translocase subunit SecA